MIKIQDDVTKLMVR